MGILKKLFSSNKVKIVLENNKLKNELQEQKEKTKEYKEKYIHYEERANEYAKKWRTVKMELALTKEGLRKLKKEGKENGKGNIRRYTKSK